MANLQRSISLSTRTINNVNIHRNYLHRSLSVGGISALSNDLVDIYAQLEKFVKKYDLKLAIDILRNILHNLPQTLKTANQGCQELSRYLQQAINRGNQAARVYAAQNENFQFGPIVHKDLHTSNTIMAAVLLMKQYFYNLSNCINN